MSVRQLLAAVGRVANCFEFKVAHYLAKKRTKRHTFFYQKIFKPKIALKFEIQVENQPQQPPTADELRSKIQFNQCGQKGGIFPF